MTSQLSILFTHGFIIKSLGWGMSPPPGRIGLSQMKVLARNCFEFKLSCKNAPPPATMRDCVV